MPNQIHVAIAAVAVIAISFFVVAILYWVENEKRRVLLVSLAIVVCFSLLAFGISVMSWYARLPVLAKAAWELCLTAYSASTAGVLSAAWVGILARRRYLKHGKWRTMLRRHWKGFVFGALTPWLIAFVWNFYHVYQVVVVHFPRTNISWVHNENYEVMSGDSQNITPEFLRSHPQYVLVVAPRGGDLVPTSISVRLQLPFFVKDTKVTHAEGVEGVELAPAPCQPPLTISGQHAQVWGRNSKMVYILKIAKMPIGSQVRVVFLLDLEGTGMMVRIGKAPQKTPPPPPLQPLRADATFIAVSTHFTIGGTWGNRHEYAPITRDGNNVLGLDALRPVPVNGVNTFCEP